MVSFDVLQAVWSVPGQQSPVSQTISARADRFKLLPAIVELKCLYTAITRAKIGCAVVETCAPEIAEPLLQYWQQLQTAQVAARMLPHQ